ncbi:hypothetical protein LTR86_001715 [Recurvomyces mirabilis]|nr:hypothetical protein LTR86_001715 [Recurvomyces mirabilis]
MTSQLIATGDQSDYDGALAPANKISPTDNTTKTKPCRLLALPPELRNAIYTAVLTFDAPIDVQALCESGSTWILRLENIDSAVDLLSTCRQVYNEARQLFLTNSTFRLRCPPFLYPMLGAPYIEHIKHNVRLLLDRASVEKTAVSQTLIVLLGACWGADAAYDSITLVTAFQQLKRLAEEYHRWTVHGQIVLRIDGTEEESECDAEQAVCVDLRNPAPAIADAIETLRRFRVKGTMTEASTGVSSEDLSTEDLDLGISFLKDLAEALVDASVPT